MSTTQQIVLASRPQGWPTADTFRLETAELPALQPGQVLVRNTVMSVDPYMRGRMNDTRSYSQPFQVDAPLDGGAVGEVVESRCEKLPVGTHVLHGLGWRTMAVLDETATRPVDVMIAPASLYLSVLGMTGLTAYAGLMSVANFKPGDAVFVSGAAGAVGSMVGQIAKQSGAPRVIGSAGSPEKVQRLLDLGFDAAFDYHDGDVRDLLAAAAPEGIDVYFDNVGGDHLTAAINSLNLGGRIAMCGAISQYNSTDKPAGPDNMVMFIAKRLALRGFLVGDHADLAPEFAQKMGGWLAEGKISYDETFRDGLENAPQAFIDMMKGANTGKMIVRL